MPGGMAVNMSPMSTALEGGQYQGNSDPPGPTGWDGPQEWVNLQSLPLGKEATFLVNTHCQMTVFGKVRVSPEKSIRN